MAQLPVVFNVPQYIEAGLATGEYQRVGGVIVQSGSKQIVAWLRDGNVVDTASQLAGGAANPLGSLLQAAMTPLQLVDSHMTRRAISSLQQTIQSMGTLMLTGQVINMAITGTTFIVIMRRLAMLQSEIEKLSDQIRAEFNRDRDMRFKVALQAARDVLESNTSITRATGVRTAIDGLYEARENFFTEYNRLIERDNHTFEDIRLAQHYLIRATYAEISRIRSYLVIGDIDLARRRLAEDIPVFKEKTSETIRLLIGDKPSTYFHSKMSAADLQRFFFVQQWLKTGDSTNQPTVIFQIVDELRHDFWDLNQYERSLIERVNNSRPDISDETHLEMMDRLNYAEMLIENQRRLEGFEIEVRTMRLSFDEWSNLVSEEELDKHGLGMILNDDLPAYQRLAL